MLRKTRERVHGDYSSLSAVARDIAHRVYHSFNQPFVDAIFRKRLLTAQVSKAAPFTL